MSFYIQNKHTDDMRSNGKSFGAVQTIQQKQAEKIAKEKAKDKTSSQEDTVSISDEAKLIINSQLGKIQEDEYLGRVFMNAADADQLAKQVNKAQNEIDDANAAKDRENGVVEPEDEMSYKAPKAEGEEDVASPTEVKIDALKSQIESLQEQIKEKQGQIGELSQDDSPEAKEKMKMMQAEIGMLSGMVGEYQEELNELLD